MDRDRDRDTDADADIDIDPNWSTAQGHRALREEVAGAEASKAGTPECQVFEAGIEINLGKAVLQRPARGHWDVKV